ncbi:head morphogenesis [Acinetobacter phage AP22]|uniref:Putative phage head protein n=1 Tax=Acinetobacter phage AP22 TaxID=1187128 RepID=I2GUC5_9CAUD|nr:head morphogenesis [Acinetobacter phage AP22]CCH57726.1 putative phage head protein [Acinetobacter phage AP22]
MQGMMDEMRSDLIQDVVKPMRSEIAMDGILDWMGHVIDGLVSRWQDRLDKLSTQVAQELVSKAKTNYDKRLLGILRKRGFTVNFRHTQYMEDQAQIALGENVALIKSIGNEYLDKVRSAVWRSVKNGYDVESLIKQLKEIDGVKDRRAKNIAKDQTAKLNQAFEDARAKELGITKAKWLHSSAVKVPRISHVKAHGTVYDIEKGCLIDGEYIKPSISKIGCKCRKCLIIDIPETI